jgi:hypothetical protein
MGLTSPIADCLGADETTFTAFFDPLMEANMAVVDTIIKPCCAIIAFKLDEKILPELTSIMVDWAASISFDIPEIIAGLDLPIINGFDITGDISIDVEFSLAALEFAINLITIPIDIVLGWLADLPALPELPTFEFILDLVLDLGLILPEISITCIVEMLMIPFDALAAVIEAIGSLDAEGMISAGVCPGDDGVIDHGSLF